MSLLNTISTVIFIYVVIAIFLYVGQRSFIYFPTPETSWPNQQVKTFASDGKTINVWVINEGNAKAIIYFGGNAEAVANNIPQFSAIFPEHNVYLVNYRGYGGSSGKPTEAGNYRDALNIYQQLSSQHSSIAVIGRSLGSGVATYLAANSNIEKLALITPFDSIQQVAQKSFPIYPMSLLLKDKYDSLSRVKAITAPTLILIAERDEVIAAQHSDRLVNAFPREQLTVETIAEASHNTISSSSQFSAVLKRFFTP